MVVSRLDGGFQFPKEFRICWPISSSQNSRQGGVMFPLLFAFPSHTLFIICLLTHEEKTWTPKATGEPVSPEKRSSGRLGVQGMRLSALLLRVCFRKDTGFLSGNLNECI